MRLIDADALIDWIRNDSGDKLMDSLYIDHINEMQTTYDVEKVVEKLEEKAELAYRRYMDCPPNSPCFSRYRTQYEERKMCLEIVKRGIISDDDVCEWKGKEKEYIQNPHTKRLYSNEESMENVYCNTCGKKIKVVE